MANLGDLLVNDGVCTPEQIEDGIRNQVILGGLLGTNLLELGFIDEETLAQYLSRQFDTPTMYGDNIKPSPEAIALLSAKDADRLGVIPFEKESKRLQILCVNPADLDAMDELAFITGLRPDPIVIAQVRFWQLLEQVYGIHHQLRYIALNTKDFMASSFIEKAPEDDKLDQDLIDEDDFAMLYQRRDGFPKIRNYQPMPSEEMPMLDPEDLAEIDEDTEGRPPGDIERRVWHSEGDTEGRRQEDKGLTDMVQAVPSQPPMPAHQPQALSFQQATELLGKPSDRYQIARVVLRYGLSLFTRCMLFTAHRGVLLGMDAVGCEIDPLAFRSVLIPLDEPSVFQTVVNTKAHFIGALPKTKINMEFLKVMGKQVPLSAMIIPVLVRGKAVNVIYGDNGHKAHCPNDIGQLLILAQHISRSYETLFQQKKATFKNRRNQQPSQEDNNG